MSGSLLNRILTVVLLLVLATSLVAAAYVAVNPPRTTDPYTEFYLLGSEGNASDYPTRLSSGTAGTVTVGLTNHEGKTTDYLVQVVDANASGDGTLTTRSQTVAAGETWETDVTLELEETGHHRIQFLLYKSEASDEPYLTTRLWINVTAGELSNTNTVIPIAGPGNRETP